MGIFSITIKAMGASLISFLVGVCLAAAIRKIFGTSMTANAVHGSDSENSAKRELEIFSDLF